MTTARAHAYLNRSDPGDNSILDQAPVEARLWFSEAIVPGFSSARMLDLDGNPVPLNSVMVEPEDPTLMVLSLPPLEDSIYTVNWNVISAVDGHTSDGYFVFSVGAAASETDGLAGSPSRGAVRAPPAEVLLRWMNYLGLLVILGCSAVLLFFLHGNSSTQESDPAVEAVLGDARRRVLKLALAVTLVTLIVGAAQFIYQANRLKNAQVEGTFSTTLIVEAIFKTPWGYAWLARELILTFLLLWLVRLVKTGSDRRSGYILALVLALAGMLAQSMVSHAAGLQDNGLPVLVNTLHLAFAGFWIGGLIALAVGVLPAVRDERANFNLLAPVTWGKFGYLAALSVGMLAATGIYSTGRQVISADAMILTPYGKTLAIKVGLVLTAGLIGLTNSMLLHPRLSAPAARLLRKPEGWTPVKREQFPRLALLEILAGVVVVLLVGILTSLPPAKEILYTISPDEQPSSRLLSVNDIFVKLAIKPNHPGENLFLIDVVNTRRPPPGETLRVIVNLTYLSQEIGTTSLDAQYDGTEDWVDHYRLVTSSLTQPGRWKVEVIVRRMGLHDSRAEFGWTVMPLGDVPPRVLSRTPWQNSLAVVAGICAITIILLAVYVVLRKRILKSIPPQH